MFSGEEEGEREREKVRGKVSVCRQTRGYITISCLYVSLVQQTKSSMKTAAKPFHLGILKTDIVFGTQYLINT